jgi:histidinol-phosphatase (PHP family)
MLPVLPLPADNHLHTEWSFDTPPQASMLQTCERALALGIPAVAFTEHVEFTDWMRDGDAVGAHIGDNKLDWWSRIRPLDVTGYLACVEECRDRFPDLVIRTGIEAGEPHLFGGSIAAVLAQGPFDRILGSLHAIVHDGTLVGPENLYDRVAPTDVMHRYLDELLRMVQGSDVFQVLAHLDYPARYWPRGDYRETDYEEQFRAVLHALADSDRALELNTKKAVMSARMLGWWREEGGRAISFGSDAHLPWLMGTRFDQAAVAAQAAGFGPGRDITDFWRR